ncbi:MAG: hypothetical protein Q9169_004088 [Polycauliona sp. 2 TL-2023]
MDLDERKHNLFDLRRGRLWNDKAFLQLLYAWLRPYLKARQSSLQLLYQFNFHTDFANSIFPAMSSNSASPGFSNDAVTVRAPAIVINNHREFRITAIKWSFPNFVQGDTFIINDMDIQPASQVSN